MNFRSGWGRSSPCFLFILENFGLKAKKYLHMSEKSTTFAPRKITYQEKSREAPQKYHVANTWFYRTKQHLKGGDFGVVSE